jgi:hypothetical protein
LPAVDGGNTATVLSNAGPNPVWFAWASSAGPNVGGSQVLNPGYNTLITNAGSMTSIALCAFPFGANVTFQRGSVSTIQEF